jgi:hypothetical protein
MDRITKAASLALFVAATATGTAFAQTKPTPGCTPQEKSGQPLGQKLSQTNGVICPPDVDPTIKAPTPKTGDKAVIPPPGTPGGNPNVQPK